MAASEKPCENNEETISQSSTVLALRLEGWLIIVSISVHCYYSRRSICIDTGWYVILMRRLFVKAYFLRR